MTRSFATICGLLIAFGLRASPESERSFLPARRDYILACAGCHGIEGVANSSLIPSLRGRVGYFLNFPEGRAYLSRLPNVAFSTLNDGQLAGVLNYMAFDIGAGSAPAGAKPYVAAEVGKWRKQPLTEIALSAYRTRLVEILIDRYHAPTALRTYGDPSATHTDEPAPSAAVN